MNPLISLIMKRSDITLDDPDSESEPPDPRWDKLGLLSKQVYARILHNDMGNFTLSLLLCIFLRL